MPVISPKFQIVIPKEIREKHELKVGDNIEFISIGNGLQLSKKRPMKEYEGFLKGMLSDTHVEREEEDRF